MDRAGNVRMTFANPPRIRFRDLLAVPAQSEALNKLNVCRTHRLMSAAHILDLWDSNAERRRFNALSKGKAAISQRGADAFPFFLSALQCRPWKSMEKRHEVIIRPLNWRVFGIPLYFQWLRCSSHPSENVLAQALVSAMWGTPNRHGWRDLWGTRQAEKKISAEKLIRMMLPIWSKLAFLAAQAVSNLEGEGLLAHLNFMDVPCL